MLQIKAGLAVVGEDLAIRERICISVSDGVIASVERWSSCSPGAWGGEWLAALPQPANAHVHSADWVFSEYAVNLGLEDVVAPPAGLKHRLLSAMSREKLVDSISMTYRYAWRAGTGLIADFREGGGAGCSAAKDAAKRFPGLDVVVLGRPGPGWPGECDGVGLSSPLDYPREELRRLASHRPSMVHVAETRRVRDMGDLELALEAGFDAVVHGVFLSPKDLEALSSMGTGLVLCPSSNAWHGMGLPPALAAVEAGVKVALGTDNAAWNQPDPWLEARTLLLTLRLQGARGRGEADTVLRALFVNGYLFARRRPRVIAEGHPAHLAFVDISGAGIAEARNKEYALIKRISAPAVIGRLDGDTMVLFSRSYPAPRQ